MPAASDSVLTQGHFLSNLTDMRDGIAIQFTTPSVNVGANGFRADQPIILDLFFPAYTNRSPGSGVGAFTRPYMTIVVQEAGGNPATEANWRDLLWVKQIRPHVVGTTTYSNRYRVAFQTDKSQVRLSGTYLGSFPDWSGFYAAVVPGIRRGTEMD